MTNLPVKKTISAILFITGFVLLVSQIYGLLLPGDYLGKHKKDYIIAIGKIDKAYAEFGPTPKFLEMANKIFHQSVEKNNHENNNPPVVAFRENWILWLLPLVDGYFINKGWLGEDKIYVNYSITHSYKRVLRQGMWICTQNAMGFADMLTRRYNIPTYIVSLYEHKVAEAQLDNDRFIIDPYVGIMFKFGFEYAQNNLEEVKNGYLYADYDWSGTYGKKTNSVDSIPGSSHHNYKYYLIEKTANILKFFIPLVIMFSGLLLIFRLKKI